MLNMEERELWGVTKTMKHFIIYDSHKYWLSKSHDMWVPYGWSVNLRASFTDKGEARKALNKKLSFEITNWGFHHVNRWIYTVERIDK